MRINQIIALAFLLIIATLSCEKNKPFDFRDEYIGKYQVHERISSYGPCGDSYTRERDTVISVTYGLTDSTLIVLDREVWLDSLGSYYGYHYGLRIWNDSIWSYYMNGGLGCGTDEIYEGFKISDTP